MALVIVFINLQIHYGWERRIGNNNGAVIWCCCSWKRWFKWGRPFCCGRNPGHNGEKYLVLIKMV